MSHSKQQKPPSTDLNSSIKLGLASSPIISILHQATEESEAVVIQSAFPKELAIALSGFFARAFDALPLSQIPVSELKPKSKSTVVIQGGEVESHREVLDWILSCGKAGKTVAFRWLQAPSFYHYALVFLSCEKLQVSVLQAQVLARMKDIAAVQVHSIDVERVFSSISGPHRFKDMICQSIGQAMWEKRLLAIGAYKALFKVEEYHEFKEGTDAVYEQLQKQYYKTPEGKIVKKELEEKNRKAEEKREAVKVCLEENFKQAVARHHNVQPSRITPTGEGRYTLSTDGRRVGKGRGGRPGFVKVDLAHLGITPHQFRASDFPALPPKKNDKSSTEWIAETITTAEPAKDIEAVSEANKSGPKGQAETDNADQASAADLSKGVEAMIMGKE